MITVNISGYMAEVMRFIYSKTCDPVCKKIQKARKNKKKQKKSDILEDRENDKDADDSVSIHKTNNLNKPVEGVKIVDDQNDFEEDEEDEEEVNVPLSITMSIITLYIVIGAVIFHNTEGWDSIPSAYFCFITLVTIGMKC